MINPPITSQPENTRYCTRCGCPREKAVGRCPECGDAEFSLNPTITYKGWLRRHGKVKTTKIIVCGTRTFDDYKLLKRKLDKLTKNLQDVEIITGSNKGADGLAIKWAYENELVVQVYHPDWQQYGKAAGPIRNSEMIKESGAKFLIAFWDESSSGTFDAITKAKKAGLTVRVIRYDR